MCNNDVDHQPQTGVVEMAGPEETVAARDERGMTTAEYAVGTVAAVAFAGVLLKVVSSPAVQAALTAIISRALKS